MQSSRSPQLREWLDQLAAEAVAGLPGKDVGSFDKYLRTALAKGLPAHQRHSQWRLDDKHSRGHSFLHQPPRAIPVPGVGRPIFVKIASNRQELRAAFELVARNYLAVGYEGSMSCKVRFTPYHALPDSVTFIAKHAHQVLMTFTLVPDNTLLGLPLEALYREEVARLRRSRRRLAEVISLAADKDLDVREFRPVFLSLSRLLFQYHLTHGGDTLVITVNPHHSKYYTKMMGYEPLGPRRSYPAVEGHPAEAYMLDVDLARRNAPKTHAAIFDQWVPGASLLSRPIQPHLIRFLSDEASDSAKEQIRETFDLDAYLRSPRRW